MWFNLCLNVESLREPNFNTLVTLGLGGFGSPHSNISPPYTHTFLFFSRLLCLSRLNTHTHSLPLSHTQYVLSCTHVLIAFPSLYPETSLLTHTHTHMVKKWHASESPWKQNFTHLFEQCTILPISLLYPVLLNQPHLIMTLTKLVDSRWKLNLRNIQLHKTVKRE